MTNPENQILDQASNALFHYDRWRVTFLATVLRAASALGFLLIVTNTPLLSTVELIASLVVYGTLLFVTFTPMPYTVKAGTLITSTYFIGVSTILQFGAWSAASIYFLVATLFTVLLFDERVVYPVFAINLGTIVVFGTLNILGYVPIASTNVPTPTLTDWLPYTADYFVLAII